MKPGWLILRAGPCSTSSLFRLRRREEAGGPSQLLLYSPSQNLMTKWREGEEAGRKECVNIGLMLE
jgi:hypothetical protein